MIQLIKALWRQDRRQCLTIMCLNILSSLMAGIGIVMLIPMLELLDIPAGSTGWLGAVIAPLRAMSPAARAVAMVALYVGLILIKALLGRTASIKQTEFVEGYTLKLRNRLYDAVSHAGWQQLAARRQADTINLFTAQCSQVSAAATSIINLGASLISAAVQLTVACWMSLPVTAVVCAAGFLLLAVFIPVRRKSKDYGENMIRISRAFYGELYNQLNSIKEVRTYGVEEEHRQLYSHLSRSFRDTQVKFARLKSMPNIVYSLTAAVMISLVFLFSVLAVEMETARLMVLVMVFSRLWPVFSSWQNTLQNIQTYVPALEKLNEAIDTMESSVSEQRGSESIDFANRITFDNVVFNYSDSDIPVLENVNFSLE